MANVPFPQGAPANAHRGALVFLEFTAQGVTTQGSQEIDYTNPPHHDNHGMPVPRRAGHLVTAYQTVQNNIVDPAGNIQGTQAFIDLPYNPAAFADLVRRQPVQQAVQQDANPVTHVLQYPNPQQAGGLNPALIAPRAPYAAPRPVHHQAQGGFGVYAGPGFQYPPALPQGNPQPAQAINTNQHANDGGGGSRPADQGNGAAPQVKSEEEEDGGHNSDIFSDDFSAGDDPITRGALECKACHKGGYKTTTWLKKHYAPETCRQYEAGKPNKWQTSWVELRMW